MWCKFLRWRHHCPGAWAEPRGSRSHSVWPASTLPSSESCSAPSGDPVLGKLLPITAATNWPLGWPGVLSQAHPGPSQGLSHVGMKGRGSLLRKLCTVRLWMGTVSCWPEKHQRKKMEMTASERERRRRVLALTVPEAGMPLASHGVGMWARLRGPADFTLGPS